MGYVSAKFPEAPSVNGIYTVFRREIDGGGVGRVDVHDFPEIIYVRSGTAYVLVDGVEKLLKAGDVMVYAPNSTHVGARPSEFSLSIVSFDADLGAYADIYNRPITLTPRQERIIESVIDDGCKCFVPRPYGGESRGMVLREGADEYLLHRMKNELELFLVELIKTRTYDAQADGLSSEYLGVVRYLRSMVYSRLTVGKIAEDCKMSVSKLKYLIRENGGSGVINCFIELKMQEAKKLIKEGRYNLTEISDRLAFSSLHYFSRLFKKTVGTSPSEYAKKFE